MNTNDILQRLKDPIADGKGGWMAFCPCHKDGVKQGRRSLHVQFSDNGKLLLYCFAGCNYRDIKHALGLDEPQSQEQRERIVATYDYRDENGKLVYQVVRYEPKTMRQRRPDGNGGWIWKLKNTPKLLYRLPELIEAVKAGETIFVPEGEKDADNLTKLGLVATTNSGGAGKWEDSFSNYLAGADVVILPDNDDAGRKHADQVAQSLKGKAKSIKVLELPGLPEKGDVSDWLAAGGTKEELLNLVEQIAEVGVVPWDEPVAFTKYDRQAFPADVLPDWLSQYIKSLAEAKQVPVDLPGGLVLAACGAAVAGKFNIRINSDWEEPLVLQVLAVMNSGERKSGTIREIAEPIVTYEKQLAREAAPAVSENASRRKILEQRQAHAEARAAKAIDGTEREEAEAEAASIARELAGFKDEYLPRLLADDTTPEKLTTLLYQQGGRIAVLSAEGGIFDTLAGRGTKVPNFDVFLKGHSGDSIRIDRVGRASEYIENPCLTAAICCQPEILSEIFENQAFRGRGLLARFLYVMPQSRMGHRAIKPQGVPNGIKMLYHDKLSEMLRSSDGTDDEGNPAPLVLTLSPAAENKLYSFAEWLEPQLDPLGDLGFMNDWAGKLVGAIARLAGILHLAKDIATWQSPISEQTMTAAIKLGRYFLSHAKAVFGEMGANVELENAKYVLAWIKREAKTEFTKREAHYALQGRFKTVEPLEKALELLAEYKYIRAKEIAEVKRPGRKPSPTFETNPILLTQLTQLRDRDRSNSVNSINCVMDNREAKMPERSISRMILPRVKNEKGTGKGVVLQRVEEVF